MSVLVYPIAAPPGEIRLWVGVTSQISAPAVRFELDDVAVTPVAVRPLSSVRDSTLLSGANIPRMFSGLFRFSVPATGGQSHSVRVRVAGFPDVRTSVSAIPSSIPETGLHVFLTSCFHVTEASSGKLAASIRSMKRRCGTAGKPNFSILMGDQVYLDLPTLENLPSQRKPLASVFEERYLRNWKGDSGSKSFDQILSAAPFFALSDDHEFWNNYPHRSPIIQNSWTAAGRNHWKAASQAMFKGFQAFNPQDPGKPIRIDLDEVSFFLLDTRYERLDDTFLPPGGLTALRNWVDDLNDSGRIGVIVTGQSLYADAAGSIQGAVADYEYPDYEDYPDVLRQLIRIRNPLVCVTGDVHWGRVVESQSRRPAVRGTVYEVITSPSSLVTTIGKDGIRKAFDSIFGFFAGSDVESWPRHTMPEEDDLSARAFGNALSSPSLPTPYTHRVMGGLDKRGRFRKALLKGDQISLLEFVRDRSGRITVKVRYWSIDGRSDNPALTVRLFEHSRP